MNNGDNTRILQGMPRRHAAGRDAGFFSVCRWYTLLFLLCAGAAFLPYVVLGRSFVYKIDGASQYVVYLRYMGEYLRGWAGRILHGQLIPQMYDFTIGMGDDINAIVRFHPLDFLSVFVPQHLTEYLYDAILLIRYYLAGLSFCAYAHFWKTEGAQGRYELPCRISTAGILAGSMVYVFNGYMLMRAMNHPTYVSAFIVLPLLLLFAEYVMRRRGYALFSFVVFLGFVCNYYFMYICSIALLGYMLLRLPDYLRRRGGGQKGAFAAFMKLFFKMVLLYVAGMCMSLVTFLPTIFRYANSYRTTQTAARENLFYYPDIRRYGAWILNLIAPYQSSGNGTSLNFPVIVFPALVILAFFSRGKLKTLKRILVLELVFLLAPACGYVMAGFNNENNRWMFLIALALGMTVVFLTDALAGADAARRRVLAAAGLLYLALGMLSMMASSGKVFTAAAIAELAACLAALLVIGRKCAGVRAVRACVLAVTCLSAVCNAWITFLPGFGNMAARSALSGRAYVRYQNGIGSAASLIDDDGFYRVDSSSMKSGHENTGIYYGYRGVSMYNSILNADLVQAMSGEENIGLDTVTHLQDLDGRVPLESLAGIKYYVSKKEHDRPYGFSDEPVLKTDRYFVYENRNCLPFAYSYDSVISRSDYEKLDSLSRELVQLHAAVVDPADLPKEEAYDRISFAPEKILTEAPEPVFDPGMIEKTDTGYAVSQKKAVMTFSYEKKPGYACLLYLKGLGTDQKTKTVKISTGSLRKSFTLRGDENTYTLRKENYLISLMAESAQTKAGGEAEIRLTFRSRGSYSLDSILVLYVPTKTFVKDLAMLSENGMTDPAFSLNSVRGTIRLEKEKLVTFQVLHQKGWRLFVDGEEYPLICSNLRFLGASIPGGEHEILLRYETPGLRMGTALAGGAFLVWILLIIVQRRRKRAEYRNGQK